MLRVFILLFAFAICKGNAQDAGTITGKWLKTPKEDLIIEIYKHEDEYKGKISWTKDSDTLQLIGFQLLEGLKYDAKRKKWSDGTVHNPKSGATYNATAKMRTDGTLEVLAYKGLKFIGKKKYFKRVK